jgi:molybdopterin-guanine dinucleotide biosynthesis protein A
MGQPKALLPWGEGALIDAAIAALQPVVDEVLIVAKDVQPFLGRGARVVADRLPEHHPWIGVYTGLWLARHERSFVCACDMPWLQPALIRYLREALDEGVEAVVLQGPRGLEPFHAMYARRAATSLLRSWREGIRTCQGLLNSLRLRVVTGQELCELHGWERSLTNVNTPEEYARVVVQ